MSKTGEAHMKWVEVEIRSTAEAAEAVSALLLSEGAGGLVEPQPDVRVAYFPFGPQTDERIERLKKAVPALAEAGLDPGPARVLCRTLKEEAWADSWKEHFYPTKMGTRVVVRPTWRTYDAAEHEIVIDLDPGMAFGTGAHPTTAMCVRALEKTLREGDRVVDVGTGSGILSIAAVKLGACEVVACDVDEVAVRVASANFRANDVSDKAQAILGDWRTLFNERSDMFAGIRVSDRGVGHGVGVDGDTDVGGADVVVANIIADVIIDMVPDLDRLVHPSGVYIASGIIDHRAEEVREKLQEFGWIVRHTYSEGEWVCFECGKEERG